MFLYLILSAVLIIADQLVKLWIVNSFSLHDGMGFINGLVSILYVRNTGAAWGMFEGKMFFFYAITAVAVATLLYLMFKEKGKSKLLLTAYAFILAGAVGNLIDRLLRSPGFGRGHVVDFIDYNGAFVGNVADIAIVIAGVAVVWLTTVGRNLDGSQSKS